MTVRRTATRMTLAGVSAALAAGTLVSVSTTAADAETVTSAYMCQIPTVYYGEFAVTVTSAIPARAEVAGARVPAGAIDVQVSSTVPADAARLLDAARVTGANSQDFSFTMGSSEDLYVDLIELPLQGSLTTSGGTSTWNATGSNKAFTTPAATSYHIDLPFEFTLTARQGSSTSVKLECEAKTAPSEPTRPDTLVDGVRLHRQATRVATPDTVNASTTERAKLRVKVAGRYGAPTAGKVVAKDGKTVVGTGSLNKKGKAIVTLRKLTAGQHEIVLSFAGDASFKPSEHKTVVRVVRK